MFNVKTAIDLAEKATEIKFQEVAQKIHDYASRGHRKCEIVVDTSVDVSEYVVRAVYDELLQSGFTAKLTNPYYESIFKITVEW